MFLGFFELYFIAPRCKCLLKLYLYRDCSINVVLLSYNGFHLSNQAWNRRHVSFGNVTTSCDDFFLKEFLLLLLFLLPLLFRFSSFPRYCPNVSASANFLLYHDSIY